MRVSEARGIALLCGARAGLEIFEYTPQDVKVSVAGNGRADKKAIQKMLPLLVALDAPITQDNVADAVAIALTHAQRSHFAAVVAAAAIASGDTAALARAPGVGKKTAERLIVDLKSKIGRVTGLPVTGALAGEDDAHAALVALGYTASEAATALRDAPRKGSATTEERLAAALRATGRTVVAGG